MIIPSVRFCFHPILSIPKKIRKVQLCPHSCSKLNLYRKDDSILVRHSMPARHPSWGAEIELNIADALKRVRAGGTWAMHVWMRAFLKFQRTQNKQNSGKGRRHLGHAHLDEGPF